MNVRYPMGASTFIFYQKYFLRLNRLKAFLFSCDGVFNDNIQTFGSKQPEQPNISKMLTSANLVLDSYPIPFGFLF